MQDETPGNVVPVDKRSGKPFLREQRIAAPRMVATTSVHFDEATRDTPGTGSFGPTCQNA